MKNLFTDFFFIFAQKCSKKICENNLRTSYSFIIHIRCYLFNVYLLLRHLIWNRPTVLIQCIASCVSPAKFLVKLNESCDIA